MLNALQSPDIVPASEVAEELQGRASPTCDDLIDAFEMLDRADGKKDGLISRGIILKAYLKLTLEVKAKEKILLVSIRAHFTSLLQKSMTDSMPVELI